MNVKLLRKIQKHILAEPKRFIMGSWVQRKTEEWPTIGDFAINEGRFPKCGTAACIGGWTLILSEEDPDETFNVQKRAAKLLDLDYRQGCTLFDAYNWPDEFGDDFRSAKQPKRRARIAAEFIDHFIKTKGAE